MKQLTSHILIIYYIIVAPVFFKTHRGHPRPPSLPPRTNAEDVEVKSLVDALVDQLVGKAVKTNVTSQPQVTPVPTLNTTHTHTENEREGGIECYCVCVHLQLAIIYMYVAASYEVIVGVQAKAKLVYNAQAMWGN